MIMYLRALGGVLLLDCMLYGVLRMLLGKRRRLAGGISLAVLGTALLAFAIGVMMQRNFLAIKFTDEMPLYRWLFKGLENAYGSYTKALVDPANETADVVLLLGMGAVLLADVGVLIGAACTRIKDRFRLSFISDLEDFMVESAKLYPVIALVYTLITAVVIAINMALCIGVYWLLNGAWPW